VSAPRLRFAPSPTGHLHIGGARTALFNWAYARHTGGTFVLRIEDTDRQRSTDAYERSILEGLRWLGIGWDEGPDVGGPFGPYRQTERFERYRAIARKLVEDGHAYECFCSSERLDGLREEQTRAGKTPAYDRRCRDLTADERERRRSAGERPVVRFRVPDGTTRVADTIAGDVVFQNADVDDWVMVRSAPAATAESLGSPTYNFCVVCDDIDMRITHVLRGEEHLTNTPKQVLLFQALGLVPPAYAHLPLMLGKDKKKLSKRTGDTALQDYRDKGYPPEAVCNFLCLQGWALDDKTTLFSLDELVKHFEPRGVRPGGSIFDPEKFLWMAGEYVRREPLEELASRCEPFVVRAGLMTPAEIAARRDWFQRAVASERERIRLYSELPERLAYLFAPDDEVPYQEKAVDGARKHADGARVLVEFQAWLAAELRPGATPAALREGARAWMGERGLAMPVLFQALRCALTGAAGGADLFEVIELLGREKTLRRIERARSRLYG
jgi:glutamyl-tRNA synthetase